MIKKRRETSLNEPDDYKSMCNSNADKDSELYLHVEELESPAFQKFGSTLALSLWKV